MPLPTTKTQPITDPAKFRIMLYGPTKIGKSTWCSKAPGAIFLATEAGLGNLEVYQQLIRNWEDLILAIQEIETGKHQFKTIVIDTIDNAYRMCGEYICRKHGVEHESDLSYGKGFAFLRNEFFRFLTRCSKLQYGLILVSHSVEREIETRTGKWVKCVPTLPDRAAEIALGMVDIIMFADIETKQNDKGEKVVNRVLRTKPNHDYEAGDRTGRLPETLPLDYAAFLAAYNNGTAKVGAK